MVEQSESTEVVKFTVIVSAPSDEITMTPSAVVPNTSGSQVIVTSLPSPVVSAGVTTAGSNDMPAGASNSTFAAMSIPVITITCSN